MTLLPAQLGTLTEPLWFCLKAQPKHEHLAASTLRARLGVECFAPRIRFRKATRRGAVWFVEAMFPGYLFARFVYPELHRQVQAAPGVSNIVRFGEGVATIGELTVARLREKSGDDEIVILNPDVQIGSVIQIAEGALQGLEAVVTQLLPARERVKVLLEFLGRTVETEVSSEKVLPTVSPRVSQVG